MNEAILYTDGSSGKTGSGGWSAILATPHSLIEKTGFSEKTTNNRMELTAAIEGLRELIEPHKVMLVSDSAYVLNSLRHKWYLGWFEDYKKFERPRANLDLWMDLADLVRPHEMLYIKVRGHAGHQWNERADKLAVEARKKQLSIRHVSPEYELFDLKNYRVEVNA